MISFYDLPVTRVTLCNAIHNSFLDSRNCLISKKSYKNFQRNGDLEIVKCNIWAVFNALRVNRNQDLAQWRLKKVTKSLLSIK